MYIPDTVPENTENADTPLKKILLWDDKGDDWNINPGLKLGRSPFLKEKENCPVSSCALTSNRTEAESADLILFKVIYSFF